MEENLKKEFKIERIKKKVLKLLTEFEEGCNDEELSNFQKWILSGQFLKDVEKHKSEMCTEKKIDVIIKDIKDAMPLEAVMPSENIVNPVDEFKDENIIHADDFLYDDDEIEDHFSEINKYCENCGSNKIMMKEIISHSLSRSMLKYVFNVMLPTDLNNMRLLDVGSRIGAVLYGAYFYSNAEHIYGVEINKELYNIQNDIITRYKLDDRIKIINDDIINQGEFLKTFDIVVLNNVFEYFLNREQQIKVWKFLKNNLKKDCLVVTVPSIEDTLQKLDIYEEFFDWLKRVPIHQEENGYLYDEMTEATFHELYLYTVK